jgi:hypothetical protein
MSRFFILLATVLLFALSLSCNDPVVEPSTTLPGIVSVRVSRISSWSAILGSSIQPNGLATTCQFEYGTTTQYGSNTSERNIGTGLSAVAVVESLANLHAGTTYHWRAVATNGLGKSVSADSVFTTVAFDSLAPMARNDSASSIASFTARLFGTVNPRSLPTTCYFEYGTTTQYGSNTPQRSIGSGASAIAVVEPISGLHAATTYHWRIVATNGVGKSVGVDSAFATVPFDSLAPTARTDSASGVTKNLAHLFGTVNPRFLSTTCYFEYSSTNGGVMKTIDIVVGNGGSDTPVSDWISSLAEGTTYQYRIVAKNSVGYAYGEYKSLETTTDPPTVTQNQAFLFSNTKVELTGTVNAVTGTANGVSISYHFEYGTTGNYGQSTNPQALYAYPSAVVENLAPGSLYHWRIVASNSGGITYGPDSTFFLPAAVKPFDLPLRIGSRWKYWFQMLSSPLRGYHTWEVTGTDGSGNWTFIDIRQDSNYASGSPIPWRNDTVSFVLKDLPDYYQIDFSEWQGPFYQCKRIPKWIDSSKDTVKYYGTPLSYGYTGYEGVAFANGVGLVEYFGKFPQMTALPVSLSLLEYLPPGIQKSP